MKHVRTIIKKITRTLAKPLLWLVTFAIPVVMAACYGVATEFTKHINGKVVDKNTGAGIANIEVSCILKDDNSIESVYDTAQSMTENGSFVLYYDESLPCSSLRFKDIDGEANGGVYAAVDVPFDANNATDIIIEMDHE